MEAADALAQRRLAELESFTGKPRRQCEVLAAWRTDLALMAEQADGLLADVRWVGWAVGTGPGAVPPAPPPAPPVNIARAMNLQACARNVHAWGPPDPVTGWAKCVACGTVSITGGSAGVSGGYDMGDEMARSVVQLG